MYVSLIANVCNVIFSLSKNVTRQHSCQNNNTSSKHVVTAPKRNTPLTAIHENQNPAKLYTHTHSTERNTNFHAKESTRNERVAWSCHRAKTSSTTGQPIMSPRLMRPSRWRSGRVDETRNHTIESWITINSIYAAVGRIRRERDSGFRGEGAVPMDGSFILGFWRPSDNEAGRHRPHPLAKNRKFIFELASRRFHSILPRHFSRFTHACFSRVPFRGSASLLPHSALLAFHNWPAAFSVLGTLISVIGSPSNLSVRDVVHPPIDYPT